MFVTGIIRDVEFRTDLLEMDYFPLTKTKYGFRPTLSSFSFQTVENVAIRSIFL